MPSRGANASRIPQQDDIYSSSPTLSQLGNEQPPGIDLSFDLDSPPLVARDIEDMNEQVLTEEGHRAVFGRVLDLDDRAQLVSLSPPVQPSALHQRDDLMIEELSDSRVGHTRSPVLARESTALDSFSRNIRSYVPSSISIPNVTPSPPRVSRPVSFGMMAAGVSGTASASADDSLRQRGSDNSSRWDNPHRQGIVNLDDPVFQEEPEPPNSPRSSSGRGLTSYPRTDDDDKILWSGWDSIGSGSKSQLLLFLGYRSGLQVWDCTNLGSVCEIVNVSGGDGWGKVTFAGVLPTPTPRNDLFLAPNRPLIGAVSSVDEPQLIVYSLRTHEVVKKISLPGLVSFSATDRFLIISTATPELHVFSSSTLALLHIIPSTSLVSFAHFGPTLSSPIHNNNIIHTPVPSASLDYEDTASKHRQSHPVYALSGRYLAYASPPARPDSAITESRSLMSTLGGTGGIIGGVKQSDIGTAAMRVSGSVFSGIKAFGGAALHAAKTKAMGDASSETSVSPTQTRIHTGGLSNLFFSKSAPPASGAEHGGSQGYSSSGRDRRSMGEAVTPLPPTTAATMMNSVLTALPTLAVSTGTGAGSGSCVTVVDLMPLLGHTSTSSESLQPEVIAELLTFKGQPISNLSFSGDGTNLLVVPRDGQVGKVFTIRPTPRVMRRALKVNQQQRAAAPGEAKKPKTASSSYAEALRSLSHAGLHSGEESPWHLYDLRRGRTSAVIESIGWADDGRWIAIGSRKRTVHVFSVNPYGGKGDEASHLEGKVRNYSELPTPSTEVHPIVRLREFKAPSSTEAHCAPISFTFIKSTDSTLPMNLLPAATPFGVSSTPPASTHSSSPTSQPKPLSPTRLQRPKNFQDILCFDPSDGTLSLRRINIGTVPKDRTLSVSNAVPVIGGASISLPASSVSVGRLSTSPTGVSYGRRSETASGLTKMLDRPSDLVARDNIVATWHLRRGVDWAQVKHLVREDQFGGNAAERLGKADWISQAELSTSSCLPSVRSRSIYLWHQFSFYALAEDYHALIRSYKLDVPATKIEVRKEVEVSAYPTDGGESFVHGSASPMDIRRVPSSFDEPLASAMSASLGEYANPSPPVLPMLPNGAPASRFRNSIPIRNVAVGISDGVTEGLGRLRREMGRVRSPRLNPRTEQSGAGAGGGLHSWASLEFDEEDEDFVLTGRTKSDAVDGNHPDPMSRSTSRDAASILTPSSTQPDFFEDTQQVSRGSVLEEDRGWSQEDRQAIEEAERFYDISAAGLMDEEQAAPITRVTVKNKGKGKR